MSKVVTSTSKRWAGTVTIADPLTFEQADLIQSALDKPESNEDESRVWLTVIDQRRLPAIMACVEKWELENFTPDPFPASPRKASNQLVDWLFQEIFRVYIGEIEIPNE